MLEIDCPDKRYSLYYRTNKRTKWRYADYGGRYTSIDSAINALKTHVIGFVEYQICDMYDDDNIVLTGYLEKV